MYFKLKKKLQVMFVFHLFPCFKFCCIATTQIPKISIVQKNITNYLLSYRILLKTSEDYFVTFIWNKKKNEVLTQELN